MVSRILTELHTMSEGYVVSLYRARTWWMRLGVDGKRGLWASKETLMKNKDVVNSHRTSTSLTTDPTMAYIFHPIYFPTVKTPCTPTNLPCLSVHSSCLHSLLGPAS